MEGHTRHSIPGAVLLCFGGALIVVAVCFWTFAFNQWMRNDAWPDYPLSRMLEELGAGQPRVPFGQGALDWLLSLGACTAFFSAGAIVAALGGAIMLAYDRREKLRAASAA